VTDGEVPSGGDVHQCDGYLTSHISIRERAACEASLSDTSMHTGLELIPLYDNDIRS